MSKTLKILVGIVISISLTIVLIYFIDLKIVKKTILDFNRNHLFILLLIYAVSMGLRTFRWRLLIEHRIKISNLPIFKALAIGFMINNLLPLKLGELARMEYLKRKNNLGRSFLLGTIYIERLLDILMVLIIFILSLILMQSSKNELVQKQWIIFPMAGIIIISIFLMIDNNSKKWLIRIIPIKLKSRVESILKSFSEAILFIKNKRLLLGISILSILIWVLILLSTYIILWGLEIKLPSYAYFFLVAAGVLGIIIPSTSGNIGVYHAIATGALMLFNISPDKALAYAIIAHAFDFFPNIILGGSILLFDKNKKFHQQS